MEPGWNLDGIGRNYTYSTPSQLSVDYRSVHFPHVDKQSCHVETSRKDRGHCGNIEAAAKQGGSRWRSSVIIVDIWQ